MIVRGGIRPQATPIDSGASAEAKALLSFCQTPRYRILSGISEELHPIWNGEAQGPWSGAVGKTVRAAPARTDLEIEAVCGRVPLMLDMMLTGNSTRTEANRQANADFCIEWAKAGGIIRINNHQDNPWNGGPYLYTTDADLTELLDANQPTDAGTEWRAEMDRTLDLFDRIRINGTRVPVIYRVFCEQNSSRWFSVGVRTHGLQLWQDSVDYLIDNGSGQVLYEWNLTHSTTAPDGDPAAEISDMWPGTGYVDIASFDWYDERVEQTPSNFWSYLPSDVGYLSWMSYYQALVDVASANNIPVWVGEFGTGYQYTDPNHWRRFFQVMRRPNVRAGATEPYDTLPEGFRATRTLCMWKRNMPPDVTDLPGQGPDAWWTPFPGAASNEGFIAAVRAKVLAMRGDFSLREMYGTDFS